MSFWVVIDLGVEQCVRCGTVYHVRARDLSHRTVDQFSCQCGHEMNSWRGNRSFSYELISMPQQEERNFSAFA
ncbi:MAG: hypothetical protein JWM78_3736 [Verrucomicrobiaceae bacterium]|nr:hypothetical protein [Verrucomicrobiaceae bacterium]